ncbi:MAG: DUF3369 domain-containing protein [Arcobacter sp.]|nr:DUF3369 domain-containing protein [Arcobacter sp.]
MTKAMKFIKKKSSKKIQSSDTWKVLIADDEPEVHSITKTVLSDFKFEGKNIEFISTFSGKETIEYLKNNNDIALLLLDVVMETDDAGLNVARITREEINNKMIRIILRTGQPGNAPEKEVINKYELNDYKDKTELSSDKLYTTLLSSLRSYRDLIKLEQNKEGLTKIIHSSNKLLGESSIKKFAEGVLTQLTSFISSHNTSSLILENINGFTVFQEGSEFEILAKTGKFKELHDYNSLDEELKKNFNEALEKEDSILKDDYFVGYFKTDNNKINLVYIKDLKNLQSIDLNLLKIFTNNISIAFNNVYLNNEILQTQRELIETLGEVVEKRSNEASLHVKRVAKLSYFMAKEYGLSDKEAEILKAASPMHDIGKIGISDNILLKPAKLSDEEFKNMQNHATIGYEILKNSNREILKNAAIIAHEHHERWDGNGYPRKLKAEEIHIFGRITSIADVFDALAHKRCYKKAWGIEEILNLIREEKAKQFDPALVDIVLNNIDKIKDILNLK